MTDKKSLAIILGTAIGAAAVAAAVGVYVHHNNEPAIKDVNDIFDQARKTVRKLDEALEILKKPEA